MTMQIGKLTSEEANSAATLWEEAGLVRSWNDPHADIAAALACPTATILAARDGARIVGTVMAGYDGHRGWLYYVAVADDQRGTGLGRALVEAAEHWLAAQGARVIRLMVRAENDAVTGFYEALGYEDGQMIVMGKRLSIPPRLGEVAPLATEGEDGDAA
jgi:ribosomal protein S18 acetylase RimI-like enzyme